MRASLTRVAPFVRPYRGRLVLGIAAFGGSRLLEALVPWYLALGIDRIAAGSSDLTLPTFGIRLAVIARYGVVTYARYTVRSVGQNVYFDLRAALYAALQRQGELLLRPSREIPATHAPSRLIAVASGSLSVVVAL